MTGEHDSDRVRDEEPLARFVLFQDHVRAGGTVKSDAFLPPADLNLSVTRHARLTAAVLWARGQDVASLRHRPLIGRADVTASAVRAAALDAVPAPLTPYNPEHAHIVGWPADKAARKALAQRLAAASVFLRIPGLGKPPAG